ncbi:hypothetical protein J6524_02585 [Bradyrhizobium sp. WSM 1738]|uniref:hypothetical protein n=1 Tax=Bradyrhizobium hereditatis TaxID=2821405 RepID=UPI001CE3AAFF|nr:hypothetical protein [Bradyrhizobium hereditatis]MCA6113818.1 hypothetical protein [Bradyrhizobium hereditatis]
MEQPFEIWMHRLLQISIDLHNRMAEIQKLREMVRSAEAAQCGQELIHPAHIVQPVGDELGI